MKAFTHEGGRGNGSFTGGSVLALEEPVHEETRVVASAARPAGIRPHARTQDPVTAHTLQGAKIRPQGGDSGSPGVLAP